MIERAGGGIKISEEQVVVSLDALSYIIYILDVTS